MMHFILGILLLNIPEAFFLFCYISLNYNKRTKFIIKDIILIIFIAFISFGIQTLGIPTLFKNIGGIFLYYFIFRFLYYKRIKRIKLFKIIIFSFLFLLFLQITVYTPLILFLNFNIYIIHKSIIYMFISRIPIDLICLLFLLFKKERIDYKNENR